MNLKFFAISALLLLAACQSADDRWSLRLSLSLRPPVKEKVADFHFQSKPMIGIRASRAALAHMQQAQTGKACVLLADEWMLGERKDVRLTWDLGEEAGVRLREIFRERAVPNPLVKDLPVIDTGSDIIAGCILPSKDFNEAVWICIGSTAREGYDRHSPRAFRLADIAPVSRCKGNRRAYYLLPDADYDYILSLLPLKDVERSHGEILRMLSRPALSNTN